MNYSEFVRSRFKPGEKIAEEMTPANAALLNHSITSMVAESCRLDLVKKQSIYNQDKGLFIGHIETHRFEDFNPTPSQCELLHAAIGIAGEAGELLDAVRKHVFDGQPLDRDNVTEELGDLCFYMEAAMQVVGHDRESIQVGNVLKLSKRYESGYSDKAAQERKDKEGAE
jgi:NTP pyrophosphatase (non-canonical NTP hydrolase)